jgi:hypothetical protein
VRDRFGGEVAPDRLALGVLLVPAGDEAVGKLAGHAVAGKDTAIDL